MSTTTGATTEGIVEGMREHLAKIGAQERVSLCVGVLMRARGDRHADVADALGLTRTGFSGKLRGRTRWAMDDLDALARYFDVDLESLMGEAAVSGAVAAFFTELVGPRHRRPLRIGEDLPTPPYEAPRPTDTYGAAPGRRGADGAACADRVSAWVLAA